MKTLVLTSIKQILNDRQMILFLALMIVAALTYAGYVALSLQPSDLQVAVHYTSFGDTNFYRQRWFYLISFVLFGLLIAIIHSAIAIKIYLQDRRDIAVFFIWLSIFIVAIAWIITQSVLDIAFL